MTEELYVTRRHLLQTSSALGALATMAPLCSALARDEGEEIYKWALADVTPSTVPGPFYPLVNKPIDPDTDLTRSKGADERAKGQLLYLMGQVLNIKGKPVKGVEVEIWQANAAGRYSHPSDGNPAPLDPNFKGYGVAITDAEGRYRFKTISPGAYPVVPGWDRAPHIHIDLTGRRDRQTTQMWFPDHPLNAQDRLFINYPTAARKMLTCKIETPTENMEADAKIALFNVILPNG
jgi:protocatechuate 3,4-dioxygenase, beta subunit